MSEVDAIDRGLGGGLRFSLTDASQLRRYDQANLGSLPEDFVSTPRDEKMVSPFSARKALLIPAVLTVARGSSNRATDFSKINICIVTCSAHSVAA